MVNKIKKVTHVRAVNLALDISGHEIFSAISFSVRTGQVLTLMGPNGSGKTSLLRIIAGLTRASKGDITVNSSEFTFIGHKNGLKGSKTVRENLKFQAELANKPFSDDILKAFSLQAYAHWPVQTLSAGFQRRVALTRLLLEDAPLWLIDEPTTNLDATVADIFYQTLKKHIKNGGAAVVATHQMLPVTSTTLTLGA